MTKAETILQVILASINNENFISIYKKLLPDSTLSEFQKILEMKDVKRADFIRLCEAYKNELKAKAADSEENFDGNNDELSQIKQLKKIIMKGK